ncbi:hypothetical protein HKCCE3408_00995 [Rhodobacterales bacterium HKCCE3408]|nr:hypothetical protein [Rhodobacterales bacterium HKCCE3408]
MAGAAETANAKDMIVFVMVMEPPSNSDAAPAVAQSVVSIHPANLEFGHFSALRPFR